MPEGGTVSLNELSYQVWTSVEMFWDSSWKLGLLSFISLWDAGVSTQECSPCMASSTQTASQSKLITHSGPHPCQEHCDWLFDCVTQQLREDFRG